MRCPAHITGLSATPTRPACPSRASGCSSLSRIGASRVACAFLVYMLPPLPRCSGWAYSTLISPSHVSLPRKGHRVGLHIVLFEACSAFTRVAACTLARSPYFVTRYPKASDISSPPCLLRLLPAGGEHRAVFVYQIESYRYWQNQLGRSDVTRRCRSSRWSGRGTAGPRQSRRGGRQRRWRRTG